MINFNAKHRQITSYSDHHIRKAITALLFPTTLSLLDQLPCLAGTTGLHWSCDDGTLSLELARRVGKEGKLYAIYDRAVAVKSTRQQAQEEGLDQLQFMSISEWNNLPIKVSFAYARFFSFFDDSTQNLNMLWSKMNSGACLLLEELDLGKMSCFPHSTAFASCLSMLNALPVPERNNKNFSNHVVDQLSATGFSFTTTRFLPPTFLPNEHKHLFSLLFDNLVIQSKWPSANTLALNALLKELVNYERLPHSMISLPGIYQFMAKKK